MSEIPFLEEFGDRLHTAIAEPASRSRRCGLRHRFGRPRRGVALAFAAAIVLAAGGATAATLLGSSQRLADGQIGCYLGTTTASQLGSRDPARGQAPIAFCRRLCRLNDQAHTGIDAATLGFVACRQDATTVAVYVSDEKAGQCRRLGEGPLPADYSAALHRLSTLERQLAALGRRSDCVTPTRLAAETRTILTRLGFGDWRVRLPTPDLGIPAGTGGTCAGFVASSWVNPPDAAPQIWPSDRTVNLALGPPRRLAARIYHASTRLYQETYQHCYTATSVRALISHAFAGAGLTPRYATNAAPKDDSFMPASEKLYNRGCVRAKGSHQQAHSETSGLTRPEPRATRGLSSNRRAVPQWIHQRERWLWSSGPVHVTTVFDP
jgi:hypothetical protein